MVKTMSTLHIALLVCLVTMLSPGCHGRGRLIEPPSRSSVWRYGYDTPENNGDDKLNCGGFQVQYGQNGGKCGVCGDAWNGPREHEAGGKYATGIIVRKYTTGQVINVTIDLTASHKGYFEFHICPSDDPFNKVTHECLNKHPLRVADTNETRWHVLESAGRTAELTIPLELPPGMKCRACMLQWKYNGGTVWGEDHEGDQEQNYDCADVAVGHDDVTVGVRLQMTPRTTDTPSDVTGGVRPVQTTRGHYAIARGAVPRPSTTTGDPLAFLNLPDPIPPLGQGQLAATSTTKKYVLYQSKMSLMKMDVEVTFVVLFTAMLICRQIAS